MPKNPNLLSAADRRFIAKMLAGDGLPRRALGNIVRRQVDRRELSRDDAAVIVKDAASQMSRLMCGFDNEFSADRLIKMGARLGLRFELHVHRAYSSRNTEGPAKGSVAVVDHTRDPLGLRAHRIRGGV